VEIIFETTEETSSVESPPAGVELTFTPGPANPGNGIATERSKDSVDAAFAFSHFHHQNIFDLASISLQTMDEGERIRL
jgi:hypothetical protein